MHGKLLTAQIDVLVAVCRTASNAVHGSSNDLAVLEVTLKAALAALCTVLASWMIGNGVTL